jgi:hypothetical protein
MLRGLMRTLWVCFILGLPIEGLCNERVQNNAVGICSVIITEMTEGRVKTPEAKEIALAIARAGNKHFGRVTCGDMWLYMAIVYVESGFRINIVNHLNCTGLFQVHAPSWARKFGLKYADLLDLDNNADSGIRVFKYYLELYENLVPTLSAYNSDHPRAATGYARTVLATRNRIKKRFTELFKEHRESREKPRADISH